MLTFETTTAKLGHLFLKRVFDFIISGIGLIVLTPFFLVVIILIKATSFGPVFHKQERCTLYGRVFKFYKFRTMVADAEAKLKDLQKYNEMDGPVFKMSNDPRVTKVGKWLRKYSVDELPQLWNVFKGDMSLVGPRPLLMQYLSRYTPEQARRHNVLPGITGWAQIHGRNTITWEDKFKYDVWYVDHWNFWLDMKIIAETIWKVLKREGINEPGHISAGEFMGSEKNNGQQKQDSLKD